MRSYRVVEIFETLQGEGFHAGTPSIFVRFAGCNLWTGRHEDRQRDYARTGGACALFCDTLFTGGSPMSAVELASTISAYAHKRGGLIQHVVFTGGEPMLTLDEHLLEAVRAAPDGEHLVLAVETNGTIEPDVGVLDHLDWLCLSPKTKPEKIVLTRCDELKVVVPAMDPLEFAGIDADYWFVQPEAIPDRERVGISEVSRENITRAVEFTLANPLWRLSLQTHKLIGLP